MNYLDENSVDRLLDYPGLVDALQTAHAGQGMPETGALVMDSPASADDKFVSLMAWAADDMIAAKLVGVFPDNMQLCPPQPTVQGIVALFDGKTGAPLLICDGGSLTRRKTAADSALGARLLSRADSQVLLVVGAGALAPHIVEAYVAVRPSLKRIIIWNRTHSRAVRLASTLEHVGVSVQADPDLKLALAAADIVSCVTMSSAPLVRGALLRPGTHVDLIGAYAPDMREADDEVVKRAHIFVDTRTGCERSGEIAQPIAAGLITSSSILADLFDLCSGRHPGRTHPDEITMFKNVGGAHLDMYTARHLMKRAKDALEC
jgi:ornithine cyclodeaminase/alanine dehydrogenase-like protein (mu-crystallin family)